MLSAPASSDSSEDHVEAVSRALPHIEADQRTNNNTLMKYSKT